MKILFLLLVAVIVLAVTGACAVARARIRQHGFLVLAWRWHTGNTWHGQPVTDAGWRRPGTKALTPTGHAPRFHHRPRLHRAAIRSTPSAAFVLVIACGLVLGFTAALAVLAAETAAAIAFGMWRAVRRHLRRKHHRTWVHPAALVAAPLAGHAAAADPSWLAVAADRSHVRAALAPDYNGDARQRERLVETLASKLGIDSPEVSWHLAGPSPSLELAQSEPPPGKVTLADVRAVLEALKDDELLWGLGRRRAPVKSSLSGDSPHLGLSMGSGAGKSAAARSLLAQHLYRGGIGLVLDYKMISHQWATGLPNVVIARRPAEIHRALVWLGGEVDRRNEVALAGADMDGNVHAAVGPRIMVVCEELNATIAVLRAYWRQVREKGDPDRSPALDALDAVSFMGRQVLTHLLYIAQRLSDKATGGGGDARENIGVIAFARWRASTWKMLAPDFPAPPKNLTPGRLHVVSDRVQEVQGIYLTAAEARELALSGTVALLPYGMPGAPRAAAESVSRELVPVFASDQGLEQGETVPRTPFGPGSVSLSEAVNAGIFGDLKLAGVRTARHRDGAFPKPNGRHGLALLYDPVELAGWAERRENL